MKCSIYERRFRVNERPENYIRHVNNLSYLQWFIDTAIEHAQTLGWGMQISKERGLAWVAQSHQIEYLSPAYQDDDILIRTWIEKVTPTRITRRYECKRAEKVLAQARTVWVMVDYESGKAKALPKDIKETFERLLT